MTPGAWTCNACDEPIAHEEHAIELEDPTTEQEIGRFHHRCEYAAVKYLRAGLPLRYLLVHPAVGIAGAPPLATREGAVVAKGEG